MSSGNTHTSLEARFGQAVRLVRQEPDQVVEVDSSMLLEVASFLKDTPGLGFNFLIFVTAVDRIDYLEVIYGLRSMSEKHQLLLKVRCPADNPVVPSVVGIWPAANWDERETFDLFGIRFAGHPNLKRILLPDDWEGHPMRKEFNLRQRPELLY